MASGADQSVSLHGRHTDDSVKLEGTPIPIARHVLRHYCPFCSRGHQSKGSAVRHIARCFKNPASRSCKTCALWEPGEKADWLEAYPGCPEQCGVGLPTHPMPIYCNQWASLAAPRPVQVDGGGNE